MNNSENNIEMKTVEFKQSKSLCPLRSLVVFCLEQWWSETVAGQTPLPLGGLSGLKFHSLLSDWSAKFGRSRIKLGAPRPPDAHQRPGEVSDVSSHLIFQDKRSYGGYT